jgi:DNA-binding transcriptional ArsR family regulator
LGLRNVTYVEKPAVRIPYPDEEGQEVAVRFGVSLEGAEKFRWRSGDKPTLYGLRLLDEARKAGYVVLVEGESDCHTLWYHEIPALGIPGASNWREGWATYLDGIEKIYAIIEPDQGGDTLREKLTACEPIRNRLHLVGLGEEHKDSSALHLADSDGFRERFEAALKDAKPWIELERAETEAASRKAWETCRGLAKELDILGRFAEELARSGVAGEERTAKLLYLAMTSRLLERPVSVALKGPSSGGKSYLVERVLSFFPKSAYYALTAMSDRTLAYSEEPIRHRFLVIYEAAGMNSDFATYLMRSLLSEGKVRYETVEKTSEGIKPRLIEREGPTGLIVTTTAVRLHPENETRLLSLTVTDTQDQTRAVMAALAEEAGEAVPDLATWHALQVWLETAERRVLIPYAKKLADLIPPVAVRLRRDFGAILNLIRAHALLHQATRERDTEGRIVATIEDYAAVRELVADLVSEGIEATVPATVRETVEAVKRLRQDSDGEPVTVTDLARELKLDRSAVSRRIRNAKDRGYLRDLEESRHKPSRLVLGDELPDDLQILPKPKDVRADVQERALPNAHPDKAQEPHSHGQNSEVAYKACSRARVQEGIKDPPPRSQGEPEETSNFEDDIIEVVRNLFAQDVLEEKE